MILILLQALFQTDHTVKTKHTLSPDLFMSSDWLSHGTFFFCRPLEEGTTPPGRGVLSMSGLSHGVIRVDSEEKLSVLTLQDVGSVMPGGEYHADILSRNYVDCSAMESTLI